MAKINCGILDGFMGKVGTVVGYFIKGKAFMRSYVKNVANPKSAAQMLVRARFAVLVVLASNLVDALVLGLSGRAKRYKNSVQNCFFSMNWNAVTAVSPREVTVDYSKLKLSDGSLPGVIFGRADFGEQTHLTITVPFGENDGSSRASANDQVYLVAYGPDIDAVAVSTPAARSSRRATLALPEAWDGTSVQLYGFVIGNDVNNSGVASDTAYLGHAEMQ